MKTILLSGGKGKRLWPLSTNNLPKQFTNIFDDSNCMLRKTYDMILEKHQKQNIYIATCKKYEKEIKKVIPSFSNIIIEPDAIGTFGAILNVAIYLSNIKNCTDDEIISIIPTDHDVDKNFYDILFKAEEKLKNEAYDICLIGIKPTFPSTQYGYIINDNGRIASFKEKPKLKEAINLINSNAKWNSGIIVFRLSKMLDIAKKYNKFLSYNDFIKNYNSLPHNSFDIEILEKEKNIAVIDSNENWRDLGTWESLAPKISSADKFNTNIINFEKKIIKNESLKNAIVVNCVNGIRLISKKSDIICYKQWGTYIVLNNINRINYHVKIKQLKIFTGKNISYQYHLFRNENWYILSGVGEVIIDNVKQRVKVGDTLYIRKKQKHSIKAIEELEIIEVQCSNIKNSEEDIIRIEYDWDKIKNER